MSDALNVDSMRKKIKSLLRSADLKEEEIVFYMLLLKFKETTLSRLIEVSQISTTTAYRTIKRLCDRGLIEGVEINKKQKVFRPLSLHALIDRLREKQDKLGKLEKSLKGIDEYLPYMDVSDDLDDSIEIKTGFDAFVFEYLNIPNIKNRDLLAIGSVPNFWAIPGFSYHSAEERNFIRKRMANGTYARVFNESEKEIEEIQKNDTLEKRTTKLKKDLPGNENLLTITDDASFMFVCDKSSPRVIITRQPDLLKLQKDYFYNMWKVA